MNTSQLNDLYRTVRTQIEHIDNTLSQQLVWLVISQSFFVSGYSVLITGNPGSPAHTAIQKHLLLFFPAVSMLMIFFSFFDVVAGMVYIRKLVKFYEKNKHEASEHDPYPPIGGFKMLNKVKNLSPLAVPILFIMMWIWILCL